MGTIIYVRLEFKDNKGAMIVDETHITLWYEDDEDASRKYALSHGNEENRKLIHDLLKIANLGEYELTTEALKQFDNIICIWGGEE